MASQNINLFQTKTALQPFLGSIEQYVKIASMAVLSILFSGGIMVGVAFFVFGQKRDSMEQDRQKLLLQVKGDVAKESLFVMVRNRLAAIDKIVGSQVSYAPFIDTTMKMTESFSLTSLSIGEKNSVTISVQIASIEEAMRVLTTLLAMEQRKEITNPVLQSFSLDEKQIQLGLSYTVVL